MLLFRSRTLLSYSVFVAVMAGAVAVAQGQKPKRSSDTPVTTVLEDAGDVALSTNLRVQSDGLGIYLHGVDQVHSILQTSSTCCQDWEFSTTSSPNRAVLVDFRDPVDPAVARAPFDVAFVHARLIAKCHVVSSTSFPGMALGETLNCPLLLTFPKTSRANWRVAFNPIAYPDTDFAQVSCVVADTAGRCNEWTVAAAVTQPDGALKNVGRLEEVSLTGNTAPAFHGNYYMTFSMRVIK